MAIQQKWMTLQQNWDESSLEDFLLYDYWSPHIGLCTLSGFDYRACNGNFPSKLNETYALSPSSLMGHYDKDAEQAAEVLINMIQNIDRLHNIWANCRRDIEAEDYPPAFFIEWALSKHFTPDWYDWAIGTGLYIPSEPTIEVTTQPLTANAQLNNDDSETYVNLERQAQQHEIILAIIAALKFPALQIPYGGKAEIKKACLTRTKLFTESTFKRTWQAGADLGLFKILDSDKYSSKH